VRFNVVDDGSRSDQAILDALEPALGSGVVGLIGPLGSGQTKAVHELTRGRKIPQISLGSSVELTTLQPARDRYLFRTSPADDLQAKAVVKYAQEGPGGADAGAGDAGATGFKACSKFGVVYIDNSYGQKLEEAMRAEVALRGGKVVYSQVTPVEKVGDYSPIVKALLAAQPECLVLVTYVDVAAAFLEALRKSDSKLLVLGTDGLYADDLVSKSRKPDGTSFAEGVVGTNPDTTPATPAFNEFKVLYRTYHNGAEPGSYAANAYDAAILFALAVLAAGSATDTVKIRDALFDVSAGGAAFTPARYMDAAEAVRRKQDVDYKGASGSVDFDEFGDVKGGFIVWGVQGDKLETIRAYTLEDLGQ
jgi:ABC-type branched-subunit amino acid transport system substrate-binding protein